MSGVFTKPSQAVSVLQMWGHHTEFTVGLDFSTLTEGSLASTGWDERAFIWNLHDVQDAAGVMPPH